MLFSAETAGRPSEATTSSAQAPAQPPRLEAAQGHLLCNFSFPILKTWGNQRVLRCMSVNGKGESIGGGAGCRRPSEAAGDGIRAPEAGGGDDGGIEEVREKLLVHLREAADRMKLVVPSSRPPPKAEETEMEPDREADAEPSSSAAARPWKLRTRRRGSRAPVVLERQASASPPAAAEKRAVRLRSGGTERPKFSITLTRDEIDEDIYAVTGHRARRRPRKRARVVQKQLDTASATAALISVVDEMSFGSSPVLRVDSKDESWFTLYDDGNGKEEGGRRKEEMSREQEQEEEDLMEGLRRLPGWWFATKYYRRGMDDGMGGQRPALESGSSSYAGQNSIVEKGLE